MKLHILAVGQRMPAWVQTVCQDYLKRLPPECAVVVQPVKAEPRTSGKSPSALMAAEAMRLRAAVPRGARTVVLDERGAAVSSTQLAQRLQKWQDDGRDVALLVGGADGLDSQLKRSADEALRLSDLTLPHAMARVLLVEALYRAWSLNAGHPYHRE